MNKIVLVGRLVKDPELRFAAGTGTPIVNFTLAVKRPRFDKNKPEEADFINCVCFGKRAEAIANYVTKGHLFSVSGRLQIDKYVGDDGTNKFSTKVNVEDIEFLQPKGNSSNSQSTPSNYQSSEDLTIVDDGDVPF